MTIPVYFDLKDMVVSRRNDANYYMQASYKGKILNIRMDANLYNLANSQSNSSKKRTQESLEGALEGALRGGMDYGMFEIFLDKGVFDVGSQVQYL